MLFLKAPVNLSNKKYETDFIKVYEQIYGKVGEDSEESKQIEAYRDMLRTNKASGNNSDQAAQGEKQGIELLSEGKGRMQTEPISSRGSLLSVFEQKSPKGSIMQAKMMPALDKSAFPLMHESLIKEVKHEFFYYSKALDEEYIVHLKEDVKHEQIILDFYSQEGTHVFTKIHKIQGMRNAVKNPSPTNGVYDESDLDQDDRASSLFSSGSVIKVSPNGKYLYYITPGSGREMEHSIEHNDEEHSQMIETPDLLMSGNNRLSGQKRKLYESGHINMTAHVYEITTVYKKSLLERIFERINALKELYDETKATKASKKYPKESKLKDLVKYQLKINRLKDKIKQEDSMFELKEIRTIGDIEQCFGEGSQPDITNYGTLSYFNRNENRMFYEALEITSYVEYE